MSTLYDVIVLGTGGVGSSAIFHLARRGAKVLGLDRFPGGHDQGSSHGQTRIIRMAYFEHPDYVPLLRRAYELWHELEQRTGERLYHESGLLEIGPPAGVVVPGVLQSAQQHQLPIEEIDEGAFRQRFPGFVLPDGTRALFERRAGYLFVEKCVLAHLAEAKKAGAELRIHESVEAWASERGELAVKTDKASYRCKRLVITAGAWAGRLLSDLQIRLTVRRKHLHWYRPSSDVYLANKGAPAFFYESADGYFYGFPQVDGRGVKVAEHSGGVTIENPIGDSREVEPLDRQRVEKFLEQHLPQVSRTPLDHAVCYYTMSPDENFIVDQHPMLESVSFVAGLSGHGFKFTSVLGEIMADYALNGRTDQHVGFLSCQRDALNPNR